MFQAAGESLDPRQSVGACLAEAAGAAAPVGDLLAEVGLEPALAARLPHQLSGGQRQRVALARCLAVQPDVVIADEPARALDSATRQRVLALLVGAAATRGTAVLIVSHDLDELGRLCHRVLVMLAGVVVEELSTGRGCAPRHPYTMVLQAAQPARLAAVEGNWREAANERVRTRAGDPSACPFRTGCDFVKPLCHTGLPPLTVVGVGHAVRCPIVSDGPLPQFIDT